jgi:hypothetical protein
MAPCLIRDHHAEFMKLMGEHPDVRPLDDDAKAALDDPAYHAGLEQFDRDYEALTGPKWGGRGARPAGPTEAPTPIPRRHPVVVLGRNGRSPEWSPTVTGPR